MDNWRNEFLQPLEKLGKLIGTRNFAFSSGFNVLALFRNLQMRYLIFREHGTVPTFVHDLAFHIVARHPKPSNLTSGLLA